MAVWQLLLSVQLLFASSAHAKPHRFLRELHIHAETHFDFGVAVGRATRKDIRWRLQTRIARRAERWRRRTTRGARVFHALLSAQNSTYPQYIDEIAGMAFGAGVDFEALFLWNIVFDLQSRGEKFREDNRSMDAAAETHASDAMKSLGASNASFTTQLAPKLGRCSDLMLFSPEGELSAWGHNEDGSPREKSRARLLTVHIDASANHAAESFVAYAYAGQLPGNAFGANAHVAFSVNSLHPVLQSNAAAPLYAQKRPVRAGNFVARHILASPTLKEAQRRAASANQLIGQSFNLVEMGKPATGMNRRAVNIESVPLGALPKSALTNTLVLPTETSTTLPRRSTVAKAELRGDVKVSDPCRGLGPTWECCAFWAPDQPTLCCDAAYGESMRSMCTTWSVASGSPHCRRRDDVSRSEKDGETASRDGVWTRHFFHANDYLHVQGIRQAADATSRTREARVRILMALPSHGVEYSEEVRRVLGDTAAPWPDSLYGNFTLATAVFDMKAGVLNVYDGNPATTLPVATMTV
jgi:hypothetical protein